MRPIKYRRTCTCPVCEGTGLQKVDIGEEGEVYAQEPTEEDLLYSEEPIDLSEIYCPNCNGSGYIEVETDFSTGEELRVIEF